MTILLAEDEEFNRLYISELFAKTKYQLIEATNGEEAVAMVKKKENIDVVLMDINMPLINGYECTRRIKAERPDLPVIAQTAYAMSGEREISRKAGCDDYLSKPIKVSELLDTLSRYI